MLKHSPVGTARRGTSRTLIRICDPKTQRLSPQEQVSNLDEQKQKDLETKAQQLKADSAKTQNIAKCDAIRANIKAFAENSRIRIKEDGKLRYLTPEEINTKKAEHQKQLKEFCS